MSGSSRTYLVTTKDLSRHLKRLKGFGCKIDRDDNAGTATATSDDSRVLVAIQKGVGGHWITRFIDSENITWGTTEAK